MLHFYVSLHTHTAVSHILMALLWPEHAWSDPGWQRSRSNRDSSIIWGRRDLRDLHTWERHTRVGEIAVAAGCWVTGVETREESGNYSLSSFPASPLKRNSSLSLPPSLPRLWKHPIPIQISFNQFKTHTSFAPSASPPLSSSISYSQLGHASNLRDYLCWPFI